MMALRACAAAADLATRYHNLALDVRQVLRLLPSHLSYSQVLLRVDTWHIVWVMQAYCSSLRWQAKQHLHATQQLALLMHM
jgi:hypothetical protein